MYEIVTCEINGSKAEVNIRLADKDKTLPAQIDALQSAAARSFVLSEVSKRGIQGSPGISASVTFMPHDKNGQNLDDLFTKAKGADIQKVDIAYYVGNFKVQAKV